MLEKKKRSVIKIAVVKANSRGWRELTERLSPLSGEFSRTPSITG